MCNWNSLPCPKEFSNPRMPADKEKIVNDFFDELLALYKKYNVSISHEDGHGSFLLVAYDSRWDDSNTREWIKDASIEKGAFGFSEQSMRIDVDE